MSFTRIFSGWSSIVMCVLSVGMVGVLTSYARAGSLLIVENGRTETLICVDAETAEVEDRQREREAAEDLAYYIELMSGARPEIIDDPQQIETAFEGDAPVFIIGELALRTEPQLEQRLEDVIEPDPFVVGKRSRDGVERADGVTLLREGNRVYIAGSNTRSHYFAVSRLLQEWGCRWFMPTEFGECIPERDTIVVEELDHTHAPPFEVRHIWRAWNASDKGYIDFERRNFVNHEGFVAAHALGRYVEDLIPEGGTAFNVPIADPETIEHVADQLKDQFAAGGNIRLGMDDGTYESDSDLDEKLRANMFDKYFMTQMLTDNFMTFYNGVARRLLDEHPDSESTITFLSYGNITIPPQRDLYAESPLVATLAPIDIDPIHHMDDHRSPPREEYREMMYQWAEFMDGRVQIYDYDQSMLVWRDLPNPAHQAFRRDVKHYRDADILGFRTETRGAIATTFTNFYIRGQLMWNPDLDVDELLDDFYRRFYGPATEPMARYWDAIFDVWEESIVKEHEFYLIPAVYTDELVEELRGHLEDGKDAVADLRAGDRENLSRNEELYLERMRFTEKSFEVIDGYTTMVRRGAREGDYAGAEEAGREALEARVELAEMNPTFTTGVIAGIPAPENPEEPSETVGPWFNNEVAQYVELREKTDGTEGELVKMLPLEWAYRRDPNDTGLPRGFARKEADLSYWEQNSDNYADPEARKDYPTTEWEMLGTDLYAQAQGVLHPDWQCFTGFHWYKTRVNLDAGQADGNVHIHFPGLFDEAWLYVNGYLVAHREQNPMWWHNCYSFNWDVDLAGELEPGQNDITLRVHTEHHNGGMFRRPFLYRPVD